MSAGEPSTEERIARYEAYAKADPDNALLWITLGDLYHRAGRFDEATASFERAAIAEPGNPVAQSRLAHVRISQHDFRGAEHSLRQLLDAGETSPALYHDLGIALLHQRRFEEALQALDRVDEREEPSTLLYRAQAYHQLDDTEKAVACARAWAEAVPSDAALGYVALLEFDHGDLEAARGRAKGVLERDPGNPDASVVIGTWLAEQQEMDRAEVLFRTVTEREPDNSRGWLGLGLVHLYRRNFDKALPTLERARACQPDAVGIVTTIGWARFLKHDIGGAEAAFRQAIEVDRNFGEAHGGLAVVLAAQGRKEEARGEIRRARGLNPQGFGHVYAKSILLTLEGEGEEATRRLAEVFERRMRPDAPTLAESIQQFVARETVRAAGGPKPG